MPNFPELVEMIKKVAIALGPEIIENTAFVGGATTGLLLTDELVKQNVRSTDDVDLITGALSYFDHAKFESDLREKGFRNDPESDVICRMMLDEIPVDFMPTDENALGFSNRWYAKALELAEWHKLDEETSIRLLTPPYFVATKFEAFDNRGNGDILESRDIEDIFNLLDGRTELVDELAKTDPEMLAYIVASFQDVLNNSDYEYLLSSQTGGDQGRNDYLHSVIETIIGLAND